MGYFVNNAPQVHVLRFQGRAHSRFPVQSFSVRIPRAVLRRSDISLVDSQDWVILVLVLPELCWAPSAARRPRPIGEAEGIITFFFSAHASPAIVDLNIGPYSCMRPISIIVSQ